MQAVFKEEISKKVAAGILCSKIDIDPYYESSEVPPYMPNAASLSFLTPHLIFPDIQVCVLRRLRGILQTLDAVDIVGGVDGWLAPPPVMSSCY